MDNIATSLRHLVGCVLVAWLLTVGAWICPSHAASPGEAPPVPSGMARVWFLNQLIPGTAMHPPMIYVDGTPIAISPEGTVFYRDFTPGYYVFSTQNCLQQHGTAEHMTVGAGRQYALVVLTDQNGAWDCEPSQISYLRQLVPQDVAMEFRPLSYLGPK